MEDMVFLFLIIAISIAILFGMPEFGILEILKDFYIKNIIKRCNCSPGCKVPYGRCHCGCGQWTNIKGFYNEYGRYVKVGPAKYTPGHNPNMSPSQLRKTLGLNPPGVPQYIVGKRRIHDNLYKWWREEVLRRDGYKCKKCGSTKGLLAHHVEPWKTSSRQRYNPKNGVTLCHNCHAQEHRVQNSILE